MDNKHVNATSQYQASRTRASKWVAVVAVCALLPLAGGWFFNENLKAQDTQRRNDTIPRRPGDQPAAPPVKGGGSATTGGRVGFVTVDPFDLPTEAPVATKQSAETKAPAPSAPQAAAPQPTGRLAPFPVVAQSAPRADAEVRLPLEPKSDSKVPSLPPLAEKITPPAPMFLPTAPSENKVPVSAPGAEKTVPTPVLPKEGNGVQRLNVNNEKAAPGVELVAQKDQPVPVPLPQVVPPPAGGVKPAPVPLPPPQPFPPFGPDQVRMPLLGDAGVTPLGKTPHASAKVLAEYEKYIQGFIDPSNTLDLIEGRARLMLMKDTPKRIQVSDETILAYSVVANKEITLLGKKPGTTVLTMWFTSADDKGKETVLSYLVRVFPDPEAKDRLERVFQALENEINKNFPDSLVRLKLVGDKVMITGQAHDIVEATQILKIVVANTPGATKIPAESLVNVPRPEIPGAKEGATPGMENYIASGSPSVINMLRIGGVQQVMLRVVVAEVNRSAARSIGLNFSLTNNQGITYLQNLTGNITNQGAGGLGQLLGGVTPLGNLPILLDNGQVSLSVNALKRLNYAKSLAEPNLVTLNGQPASFLAGGQFPVPVVSGNAVGGLQGTTFVPYGVQLQFTPSITDKDRIRLNVNATVSTRDTSTGTNIGNSAIPGLTSRTFSSTVEMRDGQTLAVAGLIQTNAGADRDQLPFLGEIPFINRFTGFDRTSAAEQELVILITPELVNPMYHQQLPRLPGSDLFEPSDLEFYLLGRLEGRRMTDFRSPAMTDHHRIHQYNRVEQSYIFGPTGFYNVPMIPK
jgi:pilus assembly protein CpaC